MTSVAKDKNSWADQGKHSCCAIRKGIQEVWAGTWGRGETAGVVQWEEEDVSERRASR